MNRDLRAILPALIAVVLLGFMAAQTLNALQRSGRLGTKTNPHATVAADPDGRLEALLTAPDDAPSLKRLRDPFGYGRPAVEPRPTTTVQRPAPVRARPIVTAIVSDGQAPTAIIRFEGRSYTVKPGDLFAGFQVLNISSEEVVLDSGRERIVLQRPTKGR